MWSKTILNSRKLSTRLLDKKIDNAKRLAAYNGLRTNAQYNTVTIIKQIKCLFKLANSNKYVDNEFVKILEGEVRKFVLITVYNHPLQTEVAANNEYMFRKDTIHKFVCTCDIASSFCRQINRRGRPY